MGKELSTRNKRTTSYLPWDQARALIASLENEGQHNVSLMVAAGIYTGLRIGDILTLKWGTLRKGRFTIEEEKTGKSRIIDLHPDFIAIRDRYLATQDPYGHLKDDNYIFTRRRGPKRTDTDKLYITVKAANKRFATALQRHNIETANASTHTLRKTFGRRVWEYCGKSDESLLKLSMIFGHSNTMLTRRYLGITAEEISQIYRML